MGGALNKALVTCGILLILIAQQLVADEGSKAAIFFLGSSMCLSVAFRASFPFFDKVIADSCRRHYFKLHEEYVQSQQERIKKMEEELTKRRGAKT